MNRFFGQSLKYSLILSIGLAAPPFFIIYFSPYWLKPIAQFAIHSTPIQIHELNSAAPTWDSWNIALIHIGSEEFGFELRLADVSIGYSLKSLVSAQVNKINIGIANLTLNKIADPQTQSDPHLNTAFSWPPVERLPIPFSQFTIHTLEVKQELSQGWPDKFDLHLFLTQQADQIELDATVFEKNLPNLKLTSKLGITPDSHFSLNITTKENGAIVQHSTRLSPSSSEHTLSGKSTININGLIHWLDTWTNLSLEGADSFKLDQPIQIQHHLNWPKPGNYTIATWLQQAQPIVSMNNQGAITPSPHLEYARWDLIAEFQVLEDLLILEFKDSSYLTAKTILPTSEFSEIFGSEVLLDIQPQQFSITASINNITQIMSHGSVEATFSESNQGTSGILAVDAPVFSLTPELTIKSHVALTLKNSHTRIVNDVSISPWHSTLSADIAYLSERIDITLSPTRILNLAHIKMDDLLLKDLVIDSGATAFTVSTESNLESVSNWPVSISFNQLTMDDVQIRKVKAEAIVEQWMWLEEKVGGSVQLSVPALLGSWKNITLPSLDVNSAIKLDPPNATMTLTGMGINEDLSFHLKFQLADFFPTSAQFRLDWPNLAKSNYLSKLMKQRDPNAKVIDGNLHLSSIYQAEDKLRNQSLSLSLNAQDIAIVYDQILVEQMNLSGELSNLLSKHHDDVVILNVSQFNPGVPFEDLSIHVLPVIHKDFLVEIAIKNATADLLGGSVLVDPFIWSTDLSTIEIMTKLERFDLENILALVSQPGLDGSGRLDGILPIRLDNQGIRIDDGKIWARAPGGILRYQSDISSQQMATANPLLKITLDALKNYHYDELSADVDYNYQGDLTLAARLNGMNPDFNQGQKINLNINLEDNIPTLLKSLRVAQDISGMIDNKVNVK